MNISKFRIIGSGFTEEEYDLYQFSRLQNPDDAMRYLSNRLNNEIFRPKVNLSAQQHFLEDKWVMQVFLTGIGLPVPEAIGVFHPRFGITVEGASLCSAPDFASALKKEPLPLSIVMKPRGGRQGRNIVIAKIDRDQDEALFFEVAENVLSVEEFLMSLPEDAFADYDGGYHGWLVQKYIKQHPFMLEINPHTVNTFRVITFVDAAGECKIHFAVLRLGRKGSAADNWDKGGISVAVDVETGTLGKGVFKPSYGGSWVTHHPDTGAPLVGRVVPGWAGILDVCKRAGQALSGIRSVGWDIAMTPDGPVIIEGNATWSLPLAQVHSRGYLTDDVRADLAQLGAVFPIKANTTGASLLNHVLRAWRRSSGPRRLRRILGR